MKTQIIVTINEKGVPSFNGCKMDGQARIDLPLKQQIAILSQVVAGYLVADARNEAKAEEKPTILVARGH